MPVDPNEVFKGKLLIIAPHMDDEALACGGTIARLNQKDQIYIAYATDGMRSPVPVFPWQGKGSPDLGMIRIKEAVVAMGYLGIPKENVHFLNLPEAELRKHLGALRKSLNELISKIEPDHILLPFRYDRHPDHLAINHAITDLFFQKLFRGRLTEYFVYYRWRLLADRDVRRYVDPKHLVEVNIEDKADEKKAALNCYESQTTKFYEWQTRPILTPQLIDEECQNPELFLLFDPSIKGASVFTRSVLWIRLIHRLEPFLQRWKYRLTTLLKKGVKT